MIKKNFPTKILNHINKHGDITPMEAWNVYGCYRLSSVINRLRNKGHTIGTHMRMDESGKEYAQYFLVREPYTQASIPTNHQDNLPLREAV